MNATPSISLSEPLSDTNYLQQTRKTNAAPPASPPGIDLYPAPTMEHRAHRQLKSLCGTKCWRIHEVSKESPLRNQTETLIREQYSSVHNANVSDLFSNLFTISNESLMLGAVGFKGFDNRTAFVEQYLDSPAEATIRQTMDINPVRSKLVEVGNLAAKTINDAIRIIAFLCHETHSRGFDYAIFTGIQSVRVALRRLHINYVEIQIADPLKLNTDTKSWGRYYDNDPRVMIVDVTYAAATVATMFGIE